MEKITIVLEPTKENLKKTAKALEKGKTVIYPTESCYGIGCDFKNKKAVEKIYKIKKRSKRKNFITIVPDLETAKKYGKIRRTAKYLIKRFMPGPLTLVVPGKYKLKKFRFRLSSHPIASKLARLFGKPIISTSANFSGEESIYDSKKLDKFFGKVDIILDAGKLPKREVSTVLQVKDKKIKVLREGAIKKKKISNFIKGK